MFNRGTKKYYMVLVRDPEDRENTLSDFLYSTKKEAKREVFYWLKKKKFVEVLLYTGIAEDEMENYRGTLDPITWQEKGKEENI